MRYLLMILFILGFTITANADKLSIHLNNHQAGGWVQVDFGSINTKADCLKTIQREQRAILRRAKANLAAIKYIKCFNKNSTRVYTAKARDIKVLLTAKSGHSSQFEARKIIDRYSDDTETSELLVEKGAKNLNPEYAQTEISVALSNAVSSGNLKIMKLLIANGADVNAVDKDGKTALMMASEFGYIEVAESLIEGGADVNAVKESGSTALIHASHNGHTEIGKLLIANGADVNAVKESGSTALIHASYNGHTEIGKLLIANGADVNTLNKDGWTALMAASRKGHIEVAESLIEGGADVNALDNLGWSALMAASRKGHIEVAESLIEGDADVNAVDKLGFTALMIASYTGHTETAKLLIASGADVNARENRGYTAVWFASVKRHTEITELLIANGADVNAVDKDGERLIELGAEVNTETAELLSAQTQSSSFDGSYYDESNYDRLGPLTIEDGYISFYESFCELTEPRTLNDGRTLYIGLCSSEGSNYTDPITIGKIGNDLEIKWGELSEIWKPLPSDD